MTTHNKNYKMKRETADRKLKELIGRIRAYNASPTATLCITRATVFGSYVNHPEWDRISDLDVGIKYEPRYKGEKDRETMDNETDLLQMSAGVYRRMDKYEIPEQICKREMCMRNMYVTLRHHSCWLNLVGGDDEAIWDNKWMDLDVGEIVRN